MSETGQPAGQPELDEQARLQDRVDDAHTLAALNNVYPLLVGRLWRPHCTRYDCDPDRSPGCGRELSTVPAQRGVYPVSYTHLRAHET